MGKEMAKREAGISGLAPASSKQARGALSFNLHEQRVLAARTQPFAIF